LRSLLSLLIVLGTAGCTEPLCDLSPCDIRAPDCQRRLARATACLLDRPAIDIPVATISRAQLRAEAQLDLQRLDLVREQLRLDALALMNLARPQVTPLEASGFQVDFVGAFYDRRTKDISVVVDNTNNRPLDGPYAAMLVHEFTHALQDHDLRLDVLAADGDNSYDRLFARGALVEGEASLNEARASLALSNHDSYAVDWQPLLEDLQAEGTLWVATSPVPADFAYSGFAYPFGLEMIRDVFRNHRNVGLDALWEQPLQSARQVMKWPTPAPPSEDLGADAIPALPGTHVLIEDDRMGAFVFSIFLLRVSVLSQPTKALDKDAIAAMAGQLRGDHLSIFRFQSDTGPQAFVAWRLRFEDPTMAATVAAFLDGALARTWQTTQAGRDIILLASTKAPLPHLNRWRAPTFSKIAPDPAAPRLAARVMNDSRLFCRPLSPAAFVGR
jgi:hypothetical protein